MMPTAPREHVGSRYEVLRVLGRGGYAVVFEALDHRLRRIVALKTVLPNHPDPSAANRLWREAAAMASINHPNVCSVSDVGVLEDDRPYFVMDRLEGENLRDTLNRETFSNPEPAIDIAIELLSALHAAHSAGYVHRDIKPENVFLTRRSGCRALVKLLDFGCCAPLSQTPGENGLTCDLNVVGTPAYMCREQASGAALHAGLDVFAVALVLFESLTGWVARPRESRPEEAPDLRSLRADLPDELARILTLALSPDPYERYPSAVALARDLVDVRPLCELSSSSRPSRVRRAAAASKDTLRDEDVGG